MLFLPRATPYRGVWKAHDRAEEERHQAGAFRTLDSIDLTFIRALKNASRTNQTENVSGPAQPRDDANFINGF